MEKYQLVKYQPAIGLEIHVELKTEAKMFCQCPADYFGKKPNTQVCPVCLGLPGALPVPNKKAVDWTILLARALNCQVNKISKFDRKHYFYPDLPKGYQISQYDEPIAVHGKVVIARSERTKQSSQDCHVPIIVGTRHDNKETRIRRVHLEEDTGKLIHSRGETLIDFNRCGVPLVEIVTEPDFDNADEVKRFLEELQVLIRYLEISDGDMEKGTMRLEPNISVWQVQSSKLTPSKVEGPKVQGRSKILNLKTKKEKQLPSYKVEIKNINSFKFVKQAINYEIERQIELLKKGQTPIQETRGFDEKRQITYPQRIKEEAHDYRYFPEPDIPAMVFTQEYVSKIEEQLPELPQAKLERYIKELGIRYQEAFVLTRNRKMAEYYEKIISNIHSKYQKFEQLIANFIVNKKISTDLSPKEFVQQVLAKFEKKEVNGEKLNQLINQLIKTNKKAVEDYKKGKKNAIMFLVGQVMRELKEKADGRLVISKIKYQISKLPQKNFSQIQRGRHIKDQK